MVVVLSVVFLLMEALPGDYADQVAGADRAAAEEIRARHGLGDSPVVRLIRWWFAACRGDFGTSLVSGQEVLPRIWERLGMTLAIAVPAIVISATLGIVVAFAMAWLRGRTSGTRLTGAVAVVAGLPEVVLVISLMMLLSVALRLVPPVSLITPGKPVWSEPGILVLPIAALTIIHAAWTARMLRGSADDILATDVVGSARRRGVALWRIAFVHVAPRWAGPVAQAAAYLAAGILGGSVIVESMLAYAGLGQALADAVASRDTPTVQAAATVIVGISLALLTAADMATRRSERRAS